MRTVFLLALLFLAGAAAGQKTLTEEELRSLVLRYHPLAKRAGLAVTIARSNVTAARGGFDPQLRWSEGRKDLDGVTYYEETLLEVKVPTWYGVDVHAGREARSGDRLNPEETRGTLSYLGFSLPLGRDLIYDKRRAALQSARLMADASEQSRRAALNDLLRDVLEDYWDWWESGRLAQLADSLQRNAEARLQLVRTAVRLGDRAAVDTVEARTQVQALALQRAEAALALQKARIGLSAHLWTAEGHPYELPEDAQPAPGAGAPPAFDTLLARLNMHPELQVYVIKASVLRLERRLSFQQLLPDLDLKYNALVKSSNPLQSLKGFGTQNNYRYGLSLNIPLRLSEGRGNWRAAKARLAQAQLEVDQKRRDLQVKLQQQLAEWQQLAVQQAAQAETIRSYTVLLRAEEARFGAGEGSLFLVNAREQKAWEALQKGIGLEAKRARALLRLHWAAGLLAP
ncbi:TolC family protein [Flaviaesturariibacter terrae]